MKHLVPHTILLLSILLFLPQPLMAEHLVRTWESEELHAWLAVNASSQAQSSSETSASPLASIARFYQQLGYRNVWVDADGLLPQGEALWEILATAPANGLDRDSYLLPAPVAAWSDAYAVTGGIRPMPLAPVLQMDVALTAALLRYASHLHRGRVSPDKLSAQWILDRPPSTRDIPTELAAAVRNDRLVAYVEHLAPRQPAYSRLKQALVHYARIRSHGGWPSIASGPSLRRGDQDARIPSLRNRLVLTDDLRGAASDPDARYNEGVEAAVMRFQYRHGLIPDGVVGKRTLAALNVPVEDRIRQLQLNMERWRWYPDRFGERYLWVNIPDYTLAVVEKDWAVLRMRAIVGRYKRQTPNLSGRMTYLEFNPYWNVPGKIARKDILPKIMNDPAYLVRQGFKVYDSWAPGAADLNPESIAWDQVSEDRFPYRLRQEPSALNALGQVKFMFPNGQSIYIHDTPAKSLFTRTARSFSSGCVRVESPLALAHYLLHDQRWDRDRLEDTVHSGRQRTVVLKNPIPVHLVYFTAWTDETDSVHFREDVYGRDHKLHLALIQQASPPLFCADPAAGTLLASCAPRDRIARQ